MDLCSNMELAITKNQLTLHSLYNGSSPTMTLSWTAYKCVETKLFLEEKTCHYF